MIGVVDIFNCWPNLHVYMGTELCFVPLMTILWHSGLNMIVCVVIGVLQLIIWAVWGWVTKHPARYRLWMVLFGASLATLLEVYDFPPLWGFFDAHAIWHATTIPITYFWWSFIKDDATFRTDTLVKKAETLAVDEKLKTQ